MSQKDKKKDKKQKQPNTIDNRPKGVSKREWIAARTSEGRDPKAKFFSDPVADRKRALAVQKLAQQKRNDVQVQSQNTVMTPNGGMTVNLSAPQKKQADDFIRSFQQSPFSGINRTPTDNLGQGMSQRPISTTNLSEQDKAQADDFLARIRNGISNIPSAIENAARGVFGPEGSYAQWAQKMDAAKTPQEKWQNVEPIRQGIGDFISGDSTESRNQRAQELASLDKNDPNYVQKAIKASGIGGKAFNVMSNTIGSGEAKAAKTAISDRASKIAKNMHPEDLKWMTDFLDAVPAKTVTPKQEINARYIAELVGINPEQTNGKLASAFRKYIEKNPSLYERIKAGKGMDLNTPKVSSLPKAVRSSAPTQERVAKAPLQAGKELPISDSAKVVSYREATTPGQKSQGVSVKIKGNDGVERNVKIGYDWKPKPGEEPKNLSSVRKFVTGGGKVLEKSGEGGKKLYKAIETQRKSEDLLRGRWNVHIDKALDGMSEEQLANVDAVLRGESKPMDARTAGASKSLRNWFNSIGKKAEEMGFQIQTKDGVKVPFKMREDYAPQMYNFTDFQKGAMRDKALQHLVDTGQARNLGEATKLLDDFIKNNAERRFGNLEKAREIDLPGFERDPRVYAKKYAQSVAKRFSEVEHFGMKDDLAAKYINQIAQEGGDFNAAQKIFDYTTKGATQSNVVNAITQYNLATQLDLSAITNATQSINTATKAGVVNTIKGAVKGFTKEGKEVAQLAGVYDDFIQSKEASVSLNKAVEMIMWPFQKVENFNRRTAANTGVIRAQQLAKGEMTDFAKRELQSLGIDASNIKNGRISKDDMITAAYEMARKSQFKVDPIDVPVDWKSPAGKLVMQFQSFSFMQTKFIRDEVLKEAQKGNFAPLVRFIPLAISSSYAANYVRNLVTGRDPNDATKDMDIRAWDKWGKAFGDFATNKIIQAKFLADTYQNEYNTPMKKVTRTLGSIGGPTVGKIGSMLNALEAIPNQQEKNLYLRKTGKEQDPYLEGKRFLAGEIPFVGEVTKNKAFSYPKSTTTPERKAENRKVYDFADQMRELPYGDEGAKQKTKSYLEAIPDEKERKRQAYILSQNGVDTTGIRTSDEMIKIGPVFDKLKDLYQNNKIEYYKQYDLLSKEDKAAFNRMKSSDDAFEKAPKAEPNAQQETFEKAYELLGQGKEAEADQLVNSLTDAEYKDYVKARSIKRAANSSAMRERLKIDPKIAVQFVREQPKREQDRLLGLMTDEEYALYEKGK